MMFVGTVARAAASLVAGFILGAEVQPPAAVRPPSMVSRAVCQPTFQTVDGEFSAGTAFVTRLQATTGSAPSPAILVTAHHLFGPDGGLPRQIAGNDLPAFVVSVRCEGLENAADVIAAKRPLRVVDARPYSAPGNPRDVALFPLPAQDSRSLLLSDEGVGLRSPVWLIARVAGGEPPAKLLHEARVATMNARWLEFDYRNPNLDLTATSGAPIVDERGRVVGINIGVRRAGGRLIGVAQPASVLRAAVTRALAPARDDRHSRGDHDHDVQPGSSPSTRRSRSRPAAGNAGRLR